MAEYDYATSTGYDRARADWISYGQANQTVVRHSDLDRWDQAVYDLKHQVFNVRDFEAAGDGVTDDTAAIQAALDALKDAQTADATAVGGVLLFPPSNEAYVISGSGLTYEVEANQSSPLVFSGYGATIDFAGCTAAALTLSSGAFVWRNWLLQGLKFRASSASSATSAIRVKDGGSGSFMYRFQLRDLFIEAFTGTSCHGVLIDAQNGGSGIFEYQLVNVHADLTGNTTGNPVRVNSIAGSSSADFVNVNTRGGDVGLLIASTSVPMQANVIGGTFQTAQQQGIKAFLQPGNIMYSHVENNWQSAANEAAGGGGVYIEGWGNIVGLEDIRSTGSDKQRWGVDAYSYGGPLNIIGMTSSAATYPYVRVRNTTQTTGLVSLRGIPVSQVDATAVTGENTPRIDFGVPPCQVTDTYSASITPDVSTGLYRRITATNGTAFTINNPTNTALGTSLTFDIFNNSGGAMGAITWGSEFKLAGSFTNPATGKRRTIQFIRSGSTPAGTSWVEVCRAAADI